MTKAKCMSWRTLWLLTLLLHSCQASKAIPKTFLFPILKNGPFNQKRDLRSFMATARELGCGIILTGLFKHYLDSRHKYGLNTTGTNITSGSSGHHRRLGDGVKAAPKCFPKNYMHFEEVIDRAVFADWVPALTVSELQSQGWSGALEAVLYPAGKKKAFWDKSIMYVNRSIRAEPGVYLTPGAPHLVIKDAFQCQQGQGMRGLKDVVRPYRVVAVMQSSGMTADNSGPDLRKENLMAPVDTCKQSFFQANRLLRPAPWIQRVAYSYRETFFGSSSPSYLAVHVRPYPDQCVDMWKPDNMNLKADKITQCTRQHYKLHKKLGPCIAKRLKRYKLDKVFVMTHPAIWPTVEAMLTQAGVTQVWHMDNQRLNQIAGCQDHSATFLSMVEEEVAVQASHFLGTYWSSITHAIVYERLGLNHTDNGYLEKTC